MFAIVKVGSMQYKVAEGDVIRPNRLQVEKGERMTLDQVLLFSDGKNVQIGKPYLQDVKVEAEVVDEDKDDKVFAFKFKNRKGYTRKVGHRTKQTVLNITKIAA